jgi:hypothetical protein
MGYSKLGISRFKLPRFDKGYFPNADFDEIPDGGSSDCKHVFWYRSALRPFFGMDLVNSVQVSETKGNGLHYLDVNGATKRTAIFGTKFYEDVSGTWTDRTGAITISNDNLVQAINHQQGANKYAIYVNSTDAPWKWTGSGNAAVLGGSPPVFSSIAKYHDIIFGSRNESVYFSDEGDPETWDTSKWVIPFDKDVVRVIEHGDKLVVLMDDHIGSIQGYGYLDFVAEENEIRTFGCAGRLAVTNAIFKESTDVLAVLSRDGLYLVDKSFGFQKIFGHRYLVNFSQASLSKAALTFSRDDNLLYIVIPSSTSTENDYLILVDMLTGAFWPGPSIHANYIRSIAAMRDDNGVEYVYFIDNNGYSYKFNRDTINYHTGSAAQAIDARYKTKKYDLKDVHKFRRAVMLADADGDWNINMSIGFGLTTTDGTTGAINLLDSADLLTTSFTLGSSTLGGSSYIFKYLSGVAGFGRYFDITFENNVLDQDFHIHKVEILSKRRRMGGNDK